MRNKVLIIFSTALLLAIAFVGFSSYAQKESCSSSVNSVYDGRIQQIKGKVTILNHPQLGKTPASGVELVFQREGCDDCLIATNVDGEGNYELLVGIGKYKLIVNHNSCDTSGGGCECRDLLSPDQARYVDVKRGRSSPAEFNINLVVPKH